MEHENVLLDLLNRVVSLENKVAELEDLNSESNQDKKSTSAKRDRTKYLFEGKFYGKSRLVLSVVQSYLEQNSDITIAKLETTFDKSLQGSLGVVRKLDDIKENITDYQKRFFTKPDEVLNLPDGKCVVCSQWNIGNIDGFIARVGELGCSIRIPISTEGRG